MNNSTNSFVPPLTKRWHIAKPIPPQAGEEMEIYPPVIRQIIYNRGYKTLEAARRYIEAQPPEGCDPLELRGAPEAIDLIRKALRAEKKIAVYGDYDVDGVTATALLTLALESLGAQVQGYIPNRFDEGYGLNREALETLAERGIKLVITVDCGIRSPAEIQRACELGMEVIITDHHHPGPELPQAQAIINPKQPGDDYPDKNLAGVGLAYKLASGLLMTMDTGNLEKRGIPPVTDYLDLVALGTVADVAPLTDENRYLVRRGIEHLRYPHRQGVMSLIGVSRLQSKHITAENIGFALGPRLNAAGRLDSALAALELLRTQDVHRAAYLAQVLDDQNRERQMITRQVQAHAEKIALEEDPGALLLFAANPNYNPGVVGLAAGRLTEKYYRPTIVAHQGDDYVRASCRSIPEFHITDALDQCAELLVQHGGHAAAAGFTVSQDNLPELIARLNRIVQENLDGLDLRPTLNVDMEIPLYELRPELLRELDWLQPTGHQNPGAIFLSRNLKVVNSRTVGRDGSHLKLTVTDGRITYDAIAFRQGHWQENMPPYIDLVYVFELNEYNGRSTLQLNVRDFKPSGAPD
jgi:single-stranded-DNA-specific exonuclease